jgi:inorganic pyrophosphatase
MKDGFWEYLERLVEISEIEIDRPKGSTHHRYPNGTYPVSYGFLKGTTSMDKGGVDIWVGTLGEKKVVGALCTVDLFKRDTELKIIYDCTEEEIRSIIKFINVDQMRGIYIKKSTFKEPAHDLDS